MSELGEGRHACAGLDHALLGLSSYPPAGGAKILTRAVEEALRAWALLLTLEAQLSQIQNRTQPGSNRSSDPAAQLHF